MKKIILIILAIIPISLNANENAKEQKVAKYVMENIQRDYVNCYSFYKVAAQSFKDAGKDKNIIDSLAFLKDLYAKIAIGNSVQPKMIFLHFFLIR